MNGWLLAAGVVLVTTFGAALWVVTRGDVMERVVGTELAGTGTVLVLLLLAEGAGRSTYDGLALTLALLLFAGSLVFLRFLERWL